MPAPTIRVPAVSMAWLLDGPDHRTTGRAWTVAGAPQDLAAAPGAGYRRPL
jgi:hypothetical protein